MSGASLLVAGALGVAGGGLIYSVTARRDRTLNPDMRSQIAEFLTASGRTPAGPAILAHTLRIMFQSLFTERQWRLTAIGRLAVVSVLLLSTTIHLPCAKYPDLLVRIGNLPDVNDAPSIAALPLASKIVVFVR